MKMRVGDVGSYTARVVDKVTGEDLTKMNIVAIDTEKAMYWHHALPLPRSSEDDYSVVFCKEIEYTEETNTFTVTH